MKLIADRLDRISPSLTIAMTAKARALKAAGKDIIGNGERGRNTIKTIGDELHVGRNLFSRVGNLIPRPCCINPVRSSPRPNQAAAML